MVAQALRGIIDRLDRAPSGPDLVALAPIATAAQLDAMEAALPRVDGFGQGDAAAAVFAGHARLARWDRVLALLPRLKAALYLRRALEDLPCEMPEETARTIVRAAVNTRDPEIAGAAIAALSSRLPVEERSGASEIGPQAAEVLDAGRDRYEILARLVPALPCERLDAAAALIPEEGKNARMEWDGALVALALRRAECCQLSQAVDAALRSSYADSFCRACAQMSPHFPEPMATTLLEWAETAADKESTYSRVELLVEVARHRAEPHRSRLVDKALALARGIDKGFIFSVEEEKARALAGVAPLVDAERRPAVIMEAWQNAPKGGAFHGVGVFESLAPLVAELDPRRTCSRWRADLERASRERRLVLEELQALAPLVARLGGEEGVLAVIQAVEEIARWWP